MDFTTLLFFLISLTIGAGGGIGVYYFWSGRHRQKSEPQKEATVLLERIEKVFKVVMAEGYFTEIYTYQHNKEIWHLFQDRKKALVIAKAKVLVGFDFGKMRLHVEGEQRKIIVEFFPSPEILSMDTDYKFYDIEQGWINRFQSDDYTAILSEAKITMSEKAMESDLPRIANNQIQLMMFQLAASMNWKIDLQLSPDNQKMLSKLSTYRELEADIEPLND
ncbi:DUF4230 domain-containing protein [Arundinibacter roseus]|uniref:DUF4230 domain-containing protein n=1 Tax=Arundinibacter roseus TaxID=2070510 RepID=A0A4R4KF66_9BACT|nr:DUF4230 domain-containing protein [Arundinibacter roseus]TDB65231.1 DUF4230 domain-containing protein [Arundinibacter roseus]